MSALGKTAIQIYYWMVTFADQTRLAQFDDFGNEILVKQFCPAKYIVTSPATKETKFLPGANVFEEYEKIHGRVEKIGWYPYSKELAEKCTRKNPTLRIGSSDEIHAIELVVPQGHYAGAPKNVSKVQFGIKYKKKAQILIPMESLQHIVGLSIFPYDQSIAGTNKEWLVHYR